MFLCKSVRKLFSAVPSSAKWLSGGPVVITRDTVEARAKKPRIFQCPSVLNKLSACAKLSVQGKTISGNVFVNVQPWSECVDHQHVL